MPRAAPPLPMPVTSVPMGNGALASVLPMVFFAAMCVSCLAAGAETAGHGGEHATAPRPLQGAARRALDGKAAEAVKAIKAEIEIPLIADIHFDHRLAVAAAHAGADGVAETGP